MMRLLAVLIFLVASFGVFGTLSQYFHGDTGLVLWFVIDALLIFVVILVHELGHAVVAYRVGADIRAIVVLPFELRMRPRKLRFKWQAGKGDLGGYVAYTLDRIDARRKRIGIAAGGPIANLLLALAAGAAAAWLGTTSLAGTLLGALALLSAGGGIANLVPFKGSDGQQILQGVRAGRRARA